MLFDQVPIVFELKCPQFITSQSVFFTPNPHRWSAVLAVGRAHMCQVVYFRKTTDSIMAPGLEPQIIKLDAGREFSAAMWLDGDAMGVGVQKN
jgi:hypothetical protein